MWKQDGVYSITAQQGSAAMNKMTVEVEVADGAVVPEFGAIASTSTCCCNFFNRSTICKRQT